MSMTPSQSDYAFPRHRLRPVDETLRHPTTGQPRQPLVIVACGSFSPITYLHLRMFEMARDYLDATNKFQILGGYFSPVSDAYNKPGLASARHRIRMCELALLEGGGGSRGDLDGGVSEMAPSTATPCDWLMVDRWESMQTEFQRTAVVLDHFHEMLNGEHRGDSDRADGDARNAGEADPPPPIKVMLLAGGDLIESFQVPGLWAVDDVGAAHLHHILGDYGCIVLERTGSDTHSFLLVNDILYQHRRNVFVVKQLIHNDISSSKVRLFVKRGFSIRYLVPDSVLRYIEEHRLFAA